MAQPSFLDQLTGNIDYASKYTDLANEVNTKLELGRQAGINSALTATGNNKEVLDEAQAQASRQGLLGPIATALESRAQSKLTGNTASKLAGNEMGYLNKEAETNMQGGVGALKSKQLQNQSVQEMLGNITTGLGGIAGAMAGKGQMNNMNQPSNIEDTNKNYEEYTQNKENDNMLNGLPNTPELTPYGEQYKINE